MSIWQDLLAFGWSIIPAHSVDDLGFCSCRDSKCGAAGKHPRISWSAYQNRKANESEVKAWAERWPDSNWCIVTGKVSGLIAVDIDPRHGGDESSQIFPELREILAIPTPISLTGGGGQHFLFAHPGFTVPNAAGVWPGVDIRGDGGYIVAPGSKHVSQRTYEWDTSAHPADMPLGVIPSIRARLFEKGLARYRGGLQTGNGRMDVDGIIEGRVRVPEGQRNEVMLRLVGSLVGADSSEASVLSMAQTVNERSFDPPMDDDEVVRIVHNIIDREGRKQAASRAALMMMNDALSSLHPNDLTPADVIDQAAALWREAGVPTLTDWYVLRGGDEVNYMLITPENEVNLGSDLLDYNGCRRVLLNSASLLMPWNRIPPDWARRAHLLRMLAREELVEPVRAGDRVSEWIETYLSLYAPKEPEEVSQRRDWLQSQAIIVSGELWLRVGNLLRIAQRDDDKIHTITLTRMMRRAGWERGVLNDGMGGSISAWHKPLAPL